MGARPFFSSAGRCSPATFVAWIALGLGALASCLLALQRGTYSPGSYPVLIGAYALMGVVVAKLRVETVRRLRDEGAARGTGWAVAAAVAIGPSFVTFNFLGAGPNAVTIGSLVALIVAWAIMFLRPGRLGREASGDPGWFDLAAATACVIGGGLVGWFLADVSHGMAEAHRRSMAWEAAHPHPSETAPDQPADPLDAEISNNIKTLKKQEGAR